MKTAPVFGKEHAAENMAAVRHVVLNLLRQEHSHHISLRQKRLLCGLNEHYLLGSKNSCGFAL
jgi:hypothetical protein